jgi:hypothetical protein
VSLAVSAANSALLAVTGRPQVRIREKLHVSTGGLSGIYNRDLTSSNFPHATWVGRLAYFFCKRGICLPHELNIFNLFNVGRPS